MTPPSDSKTSNSALNDFTPDSDTNSNDPGTDVTETPATPSVDGTEITEADDVFEAVEDFIDTILTAAESDNAGEIVQDYLEQTTTVALKRYSTRNQISIIMQLLQRDVDYQRDAVLFAGFNTWLNEHNRHVKEGEKGYKIIAPQTGRTCPDCGNAPNYHRSNDWLDCPRAGTDPETWDVDPDADWRTGVLYYTTATTFAYHQTEPNEDVDEDEVFTKSDVDNHAVADGSDISPLFKQARTAIEDDGYTVEVRDPNVLEHGKKGSSAGGRIFVKDRDNIADQFRTLVHEYAHELLHQTDSGTVDLPDEVVETEAEAVAYAVCSYFNIDASNSQFYIRSWVEHATENAVNRSNNDTDDGEENTDGPSVHALIKDRLDDVQTVATNIIMTIEQND